MPKWSPRNGVKVVPRGLKLWLSHVYREQAIQIVGQLGYDSAAASNPIMVTCFAWLMWVRRSATMIHLLQASSLWLPEVCDHQDARPGHHHRSDKSQKLSMQSKSRLLELTGWIRSPSRETFRHFHRFGALDSVDGREGHKPRIRDRKGDVDESGELHEPLTATLSEKGQDTTPLCIM